MEAGVRARSWWGEEGVGALMVACVITSAHHSAASYESLRPFLLRWPRLLTLEMRAYNPSLT